MMDSGKTTYKMVWVRKLGMMVQIMMDSISRERSKVGVHINGMMDHSMKECGRKTKLRGKEHTNG